MSTSFPFLKIARDFSLPYGDVVRMACDIEARERMGRDYVKAIEWNADLDGRGPALLRAIRYAIDRERVRRQAVKLEGGL